MSDSPEDPDKAADPASRAIRLDKWLWYARFFKSRRLASDFCLAYGVRINGRLVQKPSALIRPHDILTFALRKNGANPISDIITLSVTALGSRRGPAPEARRLYQNISPPPINPQGNM